MGSRVSAIEPKTAVDRLIEESMNVGKMQGQCGELSAHRCIGTGAFYVMDRSYLDFTRRYKMHHAGACRC